MHAFVPASATLVGRDRELAILISHLDAAVIGHGGLVLIGGEAGIGKTALAEGICRNAFGQGARVLVGRCYDLSETPPYGPWVQLFARYQQADSGPPLPDAFSIHGMVGEVTSPTALFQQVLDFFAMLVEDGPVVLFLDDCQWADVASLDLLRFLARSIAGLPLLVLITYRDEELRRGHPFDLLLPTLVREASAARIVLRPLDIAAVRLLVTGRYVLPDVECDRLIGYVQARAEGNPFYLGELLRSLEEADILQHGRDGWNLGDLGRTRIPPLLRQVIDARLARFDVEGQRLLTIAAVIGHENPLDLWAMVAGRDEETVLHVAARALEARLLAEAADGDRVQFAHALVREALYEGVPAIHRRRLHLRVGEMLAAGRTPDPDAIASHFQRAGDDRAVAWLIRAGERAQRGYAWHTAADRFSAALALMEARGENAGERGWLLLRLGLLLRLADFERARAYVERAEEAAAQTGDALLAAYSRFTAGLLSCYLREWRRGVPAMEEGVAALDTLLPGDRDTRLRLERMGLATDPDNHRGTLAYCYSLLGVYDRARTLGEMVAAHNPPAQAAASIDCGVAASAFRALGNVYAALGQPDAAREAFRRGKEVYRAIGDHFEVLNTARRELRDVALPYRADDLEGRRRLASEITESHARAMSVTNPYPSDAEVSPLLLLEGRWHDDLPAALQRAASVGWPRAWAAWMLGVLARERGDRDEAWVQVRDALPDGPATTPEWRPYRECQALVRLAALLSLDAVDSATAQEWLETHDRWLAWNGAVLGRSEGQALWAAHYRATGNARRAREHADRALTDASAPRQPIALLAAHRLIGELAADAGQYTDAAAQLDRALALADACAAPYERALTLVAMAELHAVTEDPAVARSCADEARAICLPLRAKPSLARIGAIAARLAETEAIPRYPAGLTGREVEVLRLVAAGHTNRQIADALFLTEKTVKNHVTHILTKIDASNRAAAASFAHRHGLA